MGLPKLNPAWRTPVNFLHTGAFRNAFQKLLQCFASAWIRGSRRLYKSNTAASIWNPFYRLTDKQRSLSGQLFGNLDGEGVSNANDSGRHRAGSSGNHSAKQSRWCNSLLIPDPRSEPLVNHLGVPQHGRGEQQGVDAVQNAAMAGEQGAGVLDAGRALEG